MNHYDEYIDLSLVLKSLEEGLDSWEKDKLDRWLEQDIRNRRYYDGMRRNYERGILREIDDAELQRRWKELEGRLHKSKRRRIRLRLYYAAAIAVLLLGGSAVVFLRMPAEKATSCMLSGVNCTVAPHDAVGEDVHGELEYIADGTSSIPPLTR